MKKNLLLVILFFNAFFAYSQERSELRLNLRQAQDYALENNKSLKNIKTDQTIYKHKYWQTVAQGLPQASASVDYTNFFNYEIQFGSSSSGTTPQVDYTKLDAGDLEIIKLLQSFMGSGSTTIKMKNQSTAKLQLTQLIFSGQYIAGIQIAKIAQLLADKNIEKSEQDIKESVISTYYLGLLTQKSVELLDANLANLKETLEQTKALFNAGMIEETDVEQLQMSIIMLENSRRSLFRNIELNNNIMKFILGIDEDIEIVLVETFDQVIDNVNIAELLASEFDLTENINIQMLEKQLEISEKMLNMEKWSYAPTIAGVYSHNEKLLTTGFDMNPKNMFAISMSVPIFSSGLRNAKVQEKKLELFKVQNNKEIVEDQLRMQEKQLRFNLTSAIESYNSQKENMVLAQKIYEKTDLKFRNGVASSFDLIQANANLLQAQNSYVSASMELLQAKLQLDKLRNKI